MSGEWKQTTKYPKRMHDQVKRQEQQRKPVPVKAAEPVAKNCARCGEAGHTTRQHDAEQRRLQKENEQLKAIQPSITRVASVQSPKSLTNRARRMAKKCFAKRPHDGYPQDKSHKEVFA